MAEQDNAQLNNGDSLDTAPADAKDTRAFMKAALAKIANKQFRLKNYDAYYFGQHPINFSSEKFRTEYGKRLQHFRDNLCKIVVKAPSDRLEVIGFSSDAKSAVYNISWEAWKYSEMPRLAKRVHREAFKTGDAYVIVWGDEDENSRMHPQDSKQCCVFYDAETGKVYRGAKVWRGDNNFIYLTLYFADRIEKYVTRNPQPAGNMPTTYQAFVRRNVKDEDWPLMHPDGLDDTPAIFHFGLETSILDDVIPLQDALNKTLADLLISSESNSIQQRWTTGIAYEIDPETGKQIIPFENTAAWFATKDIDGKFGQFDESDLKGFLETAEDFRNQIANVAGIPQYYFKLEGGTIPSGEALRKAEARFTALIKDAQGDFGETWASIMRFALMFDETLPADEKAIETQWSPADPLSANEAADLAIKKKNIGISTERALSEIGYTDDDITKMAGENDAADKKKQENFAKTFDAGPQMGG